MVFGVAVYLFEGVERGGDVGAFESLQVEVSSSRQLDMPIVDGAVGVDKRTKRHLCFGMLHCRDEDTPTYSK